MHCKDCSASLLRLPAKSMLMTMLKLCPCTAVDQNLERYDCKAPDYLVILQLDAIGAFFLYFCLLASLKVNIQRNGLWNGCISGYNYRGLGPPKGELQIKCYLYDFSHILSFLFVFAQWASYSNLAPETDPTWEQVEVGQPVCPSWHQQTIGWSKTYVPQTSNQTEEFLHISSNFILIH